MILDERNEFCDAVTGVSAASTKTLRGDQIDLGSTVGDGFQSGQPALVITIDTSFVSANDNPVRFVLASDAAAAIAVDGTATEHATSQDFLPTTQLLAGTKIVIPLPTGAPAYERYLGVIQDVGAGVSGITAGTFSAYLTMDAGQWKAYAAGI